MSLELVNQFFDFGTEPFRNLDRKIRFDIFREVAASDVRGLIFTIVLDLSQSTDEAYLEEIIAVFKNRKLQFCLVQLECQLEERLKRNRHENRLAEKPTKRDVEASEKRLIKHHQKMMNAGKSDHRTKRAGFTIDNTNLTALETAKIIIEKFQLKSS